MKNWTISSLFKRYRPVKWNLTIANHLPYDTSQAKDTKNLILMLIHFITLRADPKFSLFAYPDADYPDADFD